MSGFGWCGKLSSAQVDRLGEFWLAWQHTHTHTHKYTHTHPLRKLIWPCRAGEMAYQDRTWWESGLWLIMRHIGYKQIDAHANTHDNNSQRLCTIQIKTHTWNMQTHTQPTLSDLVTKAHPHHFPVLMRPKILMSCEWALGGARGLRENILSAHSNVIVLTCRLQHVSVLLHVPGVLGKAWHTSPLGPD